jgi:hypothetical protein
MTTRRHCHQRSKIETVTGIVLGSPDELRGRGNPIVEQTGNGVSSVARVRLDIVEGIV